MNIKRSLLAGAVVATMAAGIGGAGLASAATPAPDKSVGGTSIVDKLATKFNLDKSDVQAVFDEDRAAHEAQMEADQRQRLADAVTAGKLTQAQADHITSVMNEVEALHGTDPRDETDSVIMQVKTKVHDLHQWATDNNVDAEYVMGGIQKGHGMGEMREIKTFDAGSSTKD